MKQNFCIPLPPRGNLTDVRNFVYLKSKYWNDQASAFLDDDGVFWIRR
jgi:hypothetical protein